MAILAAEAEMVPSDRSMPFRIGMHLGDLIEKAVARSTATARTQPRARRGWPNPAGSSHAGSRAGRSKYHMTKISPAVMTGIREGLTMPATSGATIRKNRSPQL